MKYLLIVWAPIEGLVIYEHMWKTLSFGSAFAILLIINLLLSFAVIGSAGQTSQAIANTVVNNIKKG
jgi:hypothetical protein